MRTLIILLALVVTKAEPQSIVVEKNLDGFQATFGGAQGCQLELFYPKDITKPLEYLTARVDQCLSAQVSGGFKRSDRELFGNYYTKKSEDGVVKSEDDVVKSEYDSVNCYFGDEKANIRFANYRGSIPRTTFLFVFRKKLTPTQICRLIAHKHVKVRAIVLVQKLLACIPSSSYKSCLHEFTFLFKQEAGFGYIPRPSKLGRLEYCLSTNTNNNVGGCMDKDVKFFEVGKTVDIPGFEIVINLGECLEMPKPVITKERLTECKKVAETALEKLVL
jgi:hypothetical protein